METNKELTAQDILSLLQSSGVTIRSGRFVTRVRANSAHFAEDLTKLYRIYPYDKNEYHDFDIEMVQSKGVRRWLKPQVRFTFNGHQPFTPLPLSQITPLFEWGSNWCVSNHYHNALIIHAAVVEKNGKAIVLPGHPGSGKSTLCAGLVIKGGFRLLSDELTILNLSTGHVIPNPRPISLKNKSINVIKQLSPNLPFSKTVEDTIKGTVSLMAAPETSQRMVDSEASPGLVIFPEYSPRQTDHELTPINKSRAFIELANQSFNYSVLGKEGFGAISKHLNTASCYHFRYDGNLSSAASIIDGLISA